MTTENIPSEKRISSRIAVNLPVKICTSDEGTATAEIVNLSQFGFLCLMKKPLLPDTLVQLTLLVPPTPTNSIAPVPYPHAGQAQGIQGGSTQSRSMKTRGVVVREDIQEASDEGLRHTVAIRFTEMEEPFRTRLSEYLEHSISFEKAIQP